MKILELLVLLLLAAESWISSQEWMKLVQDPLDAQVTDTITWISLVAGLKACGGALKRGQVMHVEISKRGLLEKDVIANAAISVCSKWGRISGNDSTKLRTRDMNSCDVVSPADFQEGGKQCFWERTEATLQELQEVGQEYDSESIVGNTVVDMYAKCGLLVETKEVFDDLLIQDVVTWRALISGYACQGDFLQVFHLFEKMREDGIHPDKVLFLRLLSSCSHLDESIPCVPDIVTWTTMLGVFKKWGELDLGQRAFDGVANMGVIGQGEEIHAVSERQKLLEKSSVMGSTLIDMHVKFASLAKAHSVVDKLLVWGVICETTELELDRKAINCFKQMKWEAEVSMAVAVMFCLKACNSVSDVDKGQEIHMELIEEGFDSGYLVGSALASGLA
ncbi:hypothetical protein L7F22_031062 [Adiantum nelumboides]|nr:hypothetical protein [Adiantum nelumboides]